MPTEQLLQRTPGPTLFYPVVAPQSKTKLQLFFSPNAFRVETSFEFASLPVPCIPFLVQFHFVEFPRQTFRFCLT